MATAESLGKSRSGKEKIDEEENNDKITFRNTPEFRKDFILSCLEEVNESGSVGSSLKQQSWEKMGKKLAEKYKCPMPYKKLRNHWDYLKKQHITWTKLLSITGHRYNSETMKFDWDEEQWTDINKTAKFLLILNFGVFSLILLLTLLLTKGTNRARVLGWVCVAFSTSVFAAPLSIMMKTLLASIVALIVLLK